MILGDEVEVRRSYDHDKGGPVHEVRSVRPSAVPGLAEPGDTPEVHLARIQRWAGPALAAKYRDGQLEHGGCLSEKPGMLAQAEDEALDLTTYLSTLRGQLGRVLGEMIAARCATSEGARLGHLDNAHDMLAAVLER